MNSSYVQEYCFLPWKSHSSPPCPLPNLYLQVCSLSQALDKYFQLPAWHFHPDIFLGTSNTMHFKNKHLSRPWIFTLFSSLFLEITLQQSSPVENFRFIFKFSITVAGDCVDTGKWSNFWNETSLFPLIVMPHFLFLVSSSYLRLLNYLGA